MDEMEKEKKHWPEKKLSQTSLVVQMSFKTEQCFKCSSFTYKKSLSPNYNPHTPPPPFPKKKKKEKSTSPLISTRLDLSLYI